MNPRRVVARAALALALAGAAPAGLLATRPAHAQSDPDTRVAKRHYDRGEKLFALGKFRQALEQYQKAYDAKSLPAFLFNIGQCHRNLGDFEAAIFSFRKYLKVDPDAENREQVEEYIAELEVEQDKANSERLGLVEKKRTPRDPEPPPEGSGSVTSKWWFWTAVGVVAVGGGIGIYAATRGDGSPDSDLGNIVFRR